MYSLTSTNTRCLPVWGRRVVFWVGSHTGK
jgi:hypothetical protein